MPVFIMETIKQGSVISNIYYGFKTRVQTHSEKKCFHCDYLCLIEMFLLLGIHLADPVALH